MHTGRSVRNAFIAESARSCGCKAYVDIKNKTNWIRRGFTPLSTAKPTKVRCFLRVKRFHPSQTRPAPARVAVVAFLYCRCEVWPPRPAQAQAQVLKLAA